MRKMNIEDQVCSLELAKKLKLLGVEQDSVFYWLDVNKTTSACYCLGLSSRLWIFAILINGHWQHRPLRICEFREQYSAFTVTELGEMLKGKAALPVWTNEALKQLAKLGVPDQRATEMVLQEAEGHSYWDDPNQTYQTMRSSGKEADARAKTLIDVLEGRRVVDGKITYAEKRAIVDGKLVLRTKDGDLP